MKSRSVLWHMRWVMPTALFLVMLGASVIWFGKSSVGQLPVLGTAPEFGMIDQYGNQFGLQDIEGKIAIFSFGFTRCHSICPTTQKHMSLLYEFFQQSDDLRLVTVSVDPENDSPEVLKAYADSWNVTDDLWVFLSAPKEDVFDLCQTGFMLPAENIPTFHTARFVLLDRLGRIRGYYDGMDSLSIDLLKEHIKLVANEEISDAS